MAWWKKIIFSVVSLIWGYVSLDYLYLVLCLLSNQQDNITFTWLKKPGLMQVSGFFMFLVWLIIMAVYTKLIRKASPVIDLIETDIQTGKEVVKRKWFDIILQYVFVLSGFIIRWAYLLLIYFPNR